MRPFEILKDEKVGLVRADRGFYAHDFLNYLGSAEKVKRDRIYEFVSLAQYQKRLIV